ncbi:MAG: hypothetical protein N2446_03770 [Elusimicrobiales bacterium]|nr:hypothetical protein [Elusimicrobiales bacterium]
MKMLLGFLLCTSSLLVYSQTTKTTSKQLNTQTVKTDDKQINISTASIKTGLNKQDVNQKKQNLLDNIDDDESEVLVDWGMSQIDTTTTQSSDEGGIPYYFGAFKGVFLFEGKNLLVFESDDGTINFIQLLKSGDKIKWKVYFQIRRVYKEEL